MTTSRVPAAYAAGLRQLDEALAPLLAVFWMLEDDWVQQDQAGWSARKRFAHETGLQPARARRELAIQADAQGATRHAVWLLIKAFDGLGLDTAALKAAVS